MEQLLLFNSIKKRTKKEPKERTAHQKLLDYFISKLKVIPRLPSWYARNMKHCKRLLEVYSFQDCQFMIDSIFNDKFWKDKADSMEPIIKNPHTWLKDKIDLLVPIRKTEEMVQIEKHIWNNIFKGDPLDNEGKSVEKLIQEALQLFIEGQDIKEIYKLLEMRVR